jgi:hypothetical protein
MLRLLIAHLRRFITINAEGFKWFELSCGHAGVLRGHVTWTQVRGAARVGEWNGLFGVEMRHPGVEKDVTIVWCESEVERDKMVTAMNSLSQLK